MMPTDGNDQQSIFTPQFSEFLNKFGKKSRALAKLLEKNRNINHAWTALDMTSSAYSMYKYWAELFLSNNSDEVHEFMHTPGAIIGIICETLFLVSIGVIASWHDKKEDNNKYTQAVVDYVPYLRELIKGLKNAYKGWRSLALALYVLSINITLTVIPVGVTLGLLTALNRSLLLKLKENRKVMMSENIKTIKNLKRLSHLTFAKLSSLSTKEMAQLILEKNALEIKHQDWKIKTLGYIGVALNGLVDSLYLYVGILSLATLVPPVLITMLVLFSIYAFSCVIVRIYEHYDFELKLAITETKAHLLSSKIDLKASYIELCLKKSTLERGELTDVKALEIEILLLEKKMDFIIEKFDSLHRLLRKQTNIHYLEAGLIGLKNALSAYSALASLIFFIATIMLLTGSTLPASLLVLTVSCGLVLISSFVSYSICKKYRSNQRAPYVENMLADKIKDCIKKNLKDQNSFEGLIKEGLTIDEAEASYIPELFETVRATWSASGKGEKFVEFIDLQEQPRASHPQDNPVIFIVDICFSLFFASVMGLRTFAKGFGREPLGNISLIDEEPLEVLEDSTSSVALHTESQSVNFAHLFFQNPRPMPYPAIEITKIVPKSELDKVYPSLNTDTCIPEAAKPETRPVSFKRKNHTLAGLSHEVITKDVKAANSTFALPIINSPQNFFYRNSSKECGPGFRNRIDKLNGVCNMAC
ncbi:MAG: hypothetical protein H0U75_12845 [Legionella sp.]|nr:hypothetical protein [Legionella sp.]